MKILPKYYNILLFIIAFSTAATAQDNVYKIKIQNLNTKNYAVAVDLISKFTSAENLHFDQKDSVFVLNSTRILDKNVVAGKLQKNFLSVAYMSKNGEATTPFPVLKNTGDAFKDAEIYEAEKTKWIKENPEAYKAMLAGEKGN